VGGPAGVVCVGAEEVGGLSPGWVPWMAEVLASARGRWWDMVLLLDQLGEIWEIILVLLWQAGCSAW
jgi:hypothetical protein